MIRYSHNKTLFFIFTLLVFLFAMRPIESFDTFWQLQSGEFIWKTGQFIYEDTFSLAADVFRLEHCWLHDILFYIAYVAGGYSLLSLLKPIIIAICAALLLRWALRKDVTLAYALPILALCVVASEPSWLLRPQLWTFLISLVYLHLLYLGRIHGMRAWAWLIPLMLVWANLHAACIFGFALIAAFWIGELWRVLRGSSSWGSMARFTLCGLLTFGVSFINPYGYRIPVSQLLGHLDQGKVSAGDAPIGMLGNMEWLPPSFDLAPWFYVVMILWGATIVFRLARRRMDVAELVFFLGFSYMGLNQVRHTTLVALLAGYFLPWAFQDMVKPVFSRVKIGDQIEAALKYGTVLCLIGLVVFRFNGGSLGWGLKQYEYPEAAADFVIGNKLPPQLYNSYDWGGYLMWRLYPQHLVFVDGRSTSMEHFSAASTIDAALPGWEQTMNKYGINTVVTRTCFYDTGEPLNLIFALTQTSDWKLVFADDSALVFTRREIDKKTPELDKQLAFQTMYKEAQRLIEEDSSRKKASISMALAALKLGRQQEAKEIFDARIKGTELQLQFNQYLGRPR